MNFRHFPESFQELIETILSEYQMKVSPEKICPKTFQKIYDQFSENNGKIYQRTTLEFLKNESVNSRQHLRHNISNFCKELGDSVITATHDYDKGSLMQFW